MFENLNIGKMFNGMFGKVANNQCRLAIDGNIAVKTSTGYKTYNLTNKRLTNVSDFSFEASDFFFVMPTTKVAVGDIILVSNAPKCVISVDSAESQQITVIDYESSEIQQIVPEHHIFMGSTYFFAKIVSILGSANKKGSISMNKIFKMMMMSSMLNGNGQNNNGFANNGFANLMLMQSMLGGKSDMFDFDFDFAESSDEKPNENDCQK